MVEGNSAPRKASPVGGGQAARQTPTGWPRTVNLMVAGCHHALSWHKARGAARAGLPRARPVW
jgi:hypothetical protein